MNRHLIHPSFLLLMVFFISALFLVMIKSFLMAILLAGIFSALAHPLYRRLTVWFRGRQALASTVTILIIILMVLLPLSGLLGIVTSQALKVGQSATPWVQEQLASPAAFSQWLEKIPFYEEILPYRETIFQKAGELVEVVTKFLVSGLQAGAMGTVNFLFTVAILLYTMFFFLMDGRGLLEKILFYMPLDDADERRLLDRFTSVARATIKGTAIIGIVQGGVGDGLCRRRHPQFGLLGHCDDGTLHHSGHRNGPGLGAGGLLAGGQGVMAQGGAAGPVLRPGGGQRG